MPGNGNGKWLRPVSGGRKNDEQAVGRNRSDNTSKVHVVADEASQVLG